MEPSGSLLGPLLSTMRERHADLVNLLAGLPQGALDWRPAIAAGSLAGITGHILVVEEAALRLAAGEAIPWPGANGEGMGDHRTEAELLAGLAALDALAARAVLALTAARLAEPQPGEERTIGAMLVEEFDHCAMHYGQAQLTRHLWEAANPSWVSPYVHWR